MTDPLLAWLAKVGKGREGNRTPHQNSDQSLARCVSLRAHPNVPSIKVLDEITGFARSRHPVKVHCYHWTTSNFLEKTNTYPCTHYIENFHRRPANLNSLLKLTHYITSTLLSSCQSGSQTFPSHPHRKTQRLHSRHSMNSCEPQSHTCSYPDPRDISESLHPYWSNPWHREQVKQSFKNPQREMLAVSHDLVGGSHSRSLSSLSILSHIPKGLSRKK